MRAICSTACKTGLKPYDCELAKGRNAGKTAGGGKEAIPCGCPVVRVTADGNLMVAADPFVLRGIEHATRVFPFDLPRHLEWTATRPTLSKRLMHSSMARTLPPKRAVPGLPDQW